jgi:hypothetical protein
MNKTLSFVRLDFITVKPYLTIKNLVIITGVTLILIYTSSNANAAIGLLMAFATLYAGYPFAIGEKSNIDVLYTTLSIRRNTVVLGRYLYALIFMICSGLFAYVISFVFLAILQKDFGVIETIPTILVLFLFFSVVVAIQLPIYFKLGYARAKFLTFLPFIAFALAIMVFSKFFSALFLIKWIAGLFEWFSDNFLLTVLLGICIWFGVMALSYRVSLLYYKRRDF